MWNTGARERNKNGSLRSIDLHVEDLLIDDELLYREDVERNQRLEADYIGNYVIPSTGVKKVSAYYHELCSWVNC